LALNGCSSPLQKLDKLKPPQVSLQGLSLQKADLLNPVFLVRLRLKNPNDAGLNLDGADAVLKLNGKKIAKGASRSPIKLAPLADSEIAVEASAQTLSALGQLLALQSKESLDYEITGHVNILNWLGGLGAIPFKAQGVVTREELLKSVESITKHK
jgi:LEA14-like dessication related protein